MKTSTILKREVHNGAIIGEEREGFASALVQSHNTEALNAELRETIHRLSVQEVIS